MVMLNYAYILFNIIFRPKTAIPSVLTHFNKENSLIKNNKKPITSILQRNKDKIKQIEIDRKNKDELKHKQKEKDLKKKGKHRVKLHLKNQEEQKVHKLLPKKSQTLAFTSLTDYGMFKDNALEDLDSKIKHQKAEKRKKRKRKDLVYEEIRSKNNDKSKTNL